MQRIGRAWRGPDGHGEGWLIYEKWVPTCSQNKPQNNKKRKAPEEEEKPQAFDDDKSTTARKVERKCDPLVQKLVTEQVCRRQFLNRVYRNPQSKTVVPPNECCDLCDLNWATRLTYHKFSSQRGPPRASRVTGEPNPNMLSCLLTWRKAVFPSVFGRSSMFGVSALISDSELERISRSAPLPSIDRLRSYLIKWSRVDTQLESMWEALKAGGFALPAEPVEVTMSKSTSTHRSEPTPGSSTTQSQQESSGPRRCNGKALYTQPKPSQPLNSTQTPALDMWWRRYLGERNYEVRHTDTDDICRILMEKAAVRAQGESTQHTHPSTPSPVAKRRRLDSQDTPHQARFELPPVLRTSAAVSPSSHIAHSAFRPLARPVGHLIVPFQRPLPPRLRPIPSFTPDDVRRAYWAAAAAHLLHPLSVPANDFTIFGVPRTCTSLPRTALLYRPPNPQPPQ
ncbi:hypothetical protein BDV93DRAFT_565793 [Ceratobasidium sp. AG-I]|nr:hypothetical protein BDV93DRAFT_565793 [Ceratobasidium sp. AG-I]